MRLKFRVVYVDEGDDIALGFPEKYKWINASSKEEAVAKFQAKWPTAIIICVE